MSSASSASPSFIQLYAGLTAGQEQAVTEIYNRFIDDLIRKATKNLDPKLRAKVDPESAVHSAYHSFCVRQQREEFSLHNWGQVYALLATITLRKCLNRNRYHHQQRRNETDHVAFEDWQQAERGPSPEDEAINKELLDKSLAAFNDDYRRMIDLYMQGNTTDQVAEEIGFSTRMVQRIVEQFQKRLRQMFEHEE